MQSNKPLESDWKTFRKMVPELRERYLARVNRELAELLGGSGDSTETEKFWDAEEMIRKQAKILCDCLDRHSRSNMIFSCLLMYRYKMLTAADLEHFSEDFRESVTREF